MSESLAEVVAHPVGGITVSRDEVQARKRDHDPMIDTEAFKRGDPECFRVVMTRFGPLIRSIVASYTDSHDDRDELYQRVSVHLLTQRARYDDWGAFRGWIIRLAHNSCRDWCSARAARKSAINRYSVDAIPVEESEALLDDPTRLLDYQGFLELLERALAELPPRQAQAFRLVHIEESSVRRAARTMKVSAATVRSHLRFARERLRELLKEARDVLS